MKYILLFLSMNAIANNYIAYGDIYDADTEGKYMYTLGYESGDWRAEVTHWESYTRTSWYKNHPEWRHAPLTHVKKHTVISLTNRIYRKGVFFIDFGVAITDRLSTVNSSHLVFRQNFGAKYKKWSIYLRHTSNAGLEGVNAGEDAIVIEYSF